jgi:hypothetical protein
VQKDVVRLVYRLQQTRLRRAEAKFRAQSLIQRYNAQKAYWQRSLREMEEGRHRTQKSKARRREQVNEDVLNMADYQAINMVRSTKGDEAAAAVEEDRKKKRQAELANAATDFMAKLDGGTKTAEAAGVPRPPESVAKPAPDIRGMSADDVTRKAEMLKDLRRRAKTGSVPENASRREQLANAPRDVDREIYDRFVAERKKLNLAVDKLSFDAVKSSLDKQRAKTRAKHNCARVDFDVVVKDGNAFLKPVPAK